MVGERLPCEDEVVELEVELLNTVRDDGSMGRIGAKVVVAELLAGADEDELEGAVVAGAVCVGCASGVTDALVVALEVLALLLEIDELGATVCEVSEFSSGMLGRT